MLPPHYLSPPLPLLIGVVEARGVEVAGEDMMEGSAEGVVEGAAEGAVEHLETERGRIHLEVGRWKEHPGRRLVEELKKGRDGESAW